MLLIRSNHCAPSSWRLLTALLSGERFAAAASHPPPPRTTKPHHHQKNNKNKLDGAKVLLVQDGDAVYAVSNKCSHLGLPLVGKTAFFQGTVAAGCVVCPAHGTAFDLATGEVKGEW